MGSILSFIIFIPLVGAFVQLFLGDKNVNFIKWITVVVSVLQFLATMFLWFNFQSKNEGSYLADGFQFVERYEWISLELGSSLRFLVEYHVAVDGVSLPMVALTSLIMLIALVSSWNIKKQVKGYFVLFNILNTSIIGCFLALDFFLFYLFFELMLLPMFFLIGIWGGPNRSYASIKFFLYTLLGSLFILVVMIALYLGVKDPETGAHSFNLLHIMDGRYFVDTSILNPESPGALFGRNARYIAFFALFIGFAIKLPMVPFHTWLPDAHVEAPTPISVILAALLLKVGGYGLIRIAYGIFPDAAIEFGYLIAIFGVISIIYGGMNALAQRDLKRMIAYSSVSHMGFVLVGLSALTIEGVSGAIFQMVSHGLISAGLFLIAGVIYDRTGDRLIDNYSGLAQRVPQFTFIVVFLFFASLGLPGLSGFVGELLVLMGAFGSSTSFPRWIGFATASGILISAIYFLWTIQRMFFGKFWLRYEEWNSKMIEVNRLEWLMFFPLLIMILFLGVFPSAILNEMQASIQGLIDFIMVNSEFSLLLED